MDVAYDWAEAWRAESASRAGADVYVYCCNDCSHSCPPFVVEFKFSGFSDDTCRSLVAMKDVSFERILPDTLLFMG